MSVLDRFKDGMGIEKMAIGLLSTAAHVGGGEAEAERVLQKLKDEYAHELAEKIRKQRHESHDHVSCLPCFIYGEAASLIDSEVSDGE